MVDTGYPAENNAQHAQIPRLGIPIYPGFEEKDCTARPSQDILSQVGNIMGFAGKIVVTDSLACGRDK
jgi:hypothetical protein